MTYRWAAGSTVEIEAEKVLATWRFTLLPQADAQADDSTRLRYTAHLGPGDSPLRRAGEDEPDRQHEHIAVRLSTFRTNMAAAVAGIAALAEGSLT